MTDLPAPATSRPSSTVAGLHDQLRRAQDRIAEFERELAEERKTVKTVIDRCLEWKEQFHQAERERDEARRDRQEADTRANETIIQLANTQRERDEERELFTWLESLDSCSHVTPPSWGKDMAEEVRRLQVELAKERARLDWLNEQIVSEIYLDDGRVIDVRGNDVRAAIDAARKP